MNDNRTNFAKWFKGPILKLQRDSETGFILVMISLALLERYLRQKSGLGEGRVNAKFLNELTDLFPMLKSDPLLAQKFWSVSRNGLMHQATFRSVWGGNKVTMGLHENAPMIEHQKDGHDDIFMISPKEFSRRVLQTIEDDFPTFEASGSLGTLSEQASIAGYSGYSGTKH